MKYGKETFKLLEGLKKIDDDIKALEQEEKRLQAEIDSKGNSYDLDAIKSTKALKQDLDLIKDSLEKAKAYRIDLLKDKEPLITDEAIKEVLEARRSINESKEVQANRKIIDDSIEAINKALNDLKAIEQEEQQEVKAFINSIAPILNELEESKGYPVKYIENQTIMGANSLGKIKSKANIYRPFASTLIKPINKKPLKKLMERLKL